MEFTRLGRSGLEVSRICLGCMTFGEPARGNPTWTLPEDESRELIRKALDLGINFFDTANIYSNGSSEEIVGRALKDFARRDEIVLATKLNSPLREGPNAAGLSRKAIMQEIDHSLRRLGTDYVDLYQIHRWDPVTPIEETLEALTDVVKAGKARYVGASSMHAWKFAKALYLSDRRGWSRFISMQNHYNLLNREEEREMVPLCAAEGVGLIPWSPLARGLLAREEGQESLRKDTDLLRPKLYGDTEEADGKVIAAVARMAARHGVPRAQVALAWLLANPAVTAPIVGVSRKGQITDAVAAVALRLSAEDLAKLAEHYVPHKVAGFT
ncbi:MAG TPA: aldo/keto reductase [Geminicoccus sp.]|jgi:aryl-alcohol dehydrogenase-like predicted oxidoreductase|uniref:aldo/keto reductase n=1 Tax=Geminicoccus sp. TaxID=2024832 RepID=UPI002E322BEA|nr:aldo/keto reductase [Geminicoccus sp.]HEX2527365.1 aldo/keto reductase [Geminicoccus sp.]